MVVSLRHDEDHHHGAEQLDSALTYPRPENRDLFGSSGVREIAAGPAGPVSIELKLVPSGGRLLINGPNVPPVSVNGRIEPARVRQQRERAEAAALARGRPTAFERNQAARFRNWAAAADLFSRKAGAVDMTVAGVQADLRPGGGHLVRSSFDVSAHVNDRTYVLSQSGRRTAQVRRDGQPLTRLRRTAPNRQPRYDSDLVWETGADDLDVVMTHALASAYRVGANGLLLNVLMWTGKLLMWTGGIVLAVASGG